MTRARELWDWLQIVDAPFTFLLALPFLIATAAFVGEWVRRRTGRNRDNLTASKS